MNKFRAFIKIKKAIKPVQPVGIIDFVRETITIEQGLILPFDKVILMQSTGLKDKKGVEIYEGDIVTLKYPRDRRYKVVAKVVNGQEISAMVLKFDNDFTTEEFPLYKISAENNLEVIGNIYENPELLEERNK